MKSVKAPFIIILFSLGLSFNGIAQTKNLDREAKSAMLRATRFMVENYEDYTSFYTFNDEVISGNIDFLIKCYANWAESVSLIQFVGG